jgi:hypoxanthine phosphoribosyltransferase
MIEKRYIEAQDLLEDSFRLAAKVYKSGFRPTFIVAVWRGGAPIGAAVQEFLGFVGVPTDHIAIRTSSYHGIDSPGEVRVYELGYLVKTLTHEDRLLIVDDVFDSGHTIAAIIRELSVRLKRNLPAEVRVAVPYYKPTRNKTELTPDYFLHETDKWLVFPHSLEGLSREEIAANRPEALKIIDDVLSQE